MGAGLGAGLLVRADRRGNCVLFGGGEGGTATEAGVGDDSFRRLAGAGGYVGDGVGRLLDAAWEAEIDPLEEDQAAACIEGLPFAALAVALFDRL